MKTVKKADHEPKNHSKRNRLEKGTWESEAESVNKPEIGMIFQEKRGPTTAKRAGIKKNGAHFSEKKAGPS